MQRAIWKGAVSFGLIYMPVELYAASSDGSLDLHLLDSRDFAPVGYHRVNKITGKEVDWGDIVKGYEYEKGQYVALSDADFKEANIKATQTIEISSFTQLADIPTPYYETPYYLAPTKGGEKAYALLRETLLSTRKVAVATIVMRGRQHLCVVGAEEKALILNTLRFAAELKPPEGLKLPPASAKAAKLSPKELTMAEKLVEDMTSAWKPEEFTDTYRADLMRRIEEKIRKKQTHVLASETKAPKERQGAQVIDLMAALQKSLESRGGKKAAQRRPAATAKTRRSA